MFSKKDKSEISKTEKEILEAEILRLKKENTDLHKQLTIANQYKNEYKVLCADFKSRSKKLEELIKKTESLGREKQAILDKLK